MHFTTKLCGIVSLINRQVAYAEPHAPFKIGFISKLVSISGVPLKVIHLNGSILSLFNFFQLKCFHSFNHITFFFVFEYYHNWSITIHLKNKDSTAIFVSLSKYKTSFNVSSFLLLPIWYIISWGGSNLKNEKYSLCISNVHIPYPFMNSLNSKSIHEFTQFQIHS